MFQKRIQKLPNASKTPQSALKLLKLLEHEDPTHQENTLCVVWVCLARERVYREAVGKLREARRPIEQDRLASLEVDAQHLLERLDGYVRVVQVGGRWTLM